MVLINAVVSMGGWPRLSSEKRLWVPHPTVLRVRVLNLVSLATFYFLIST